MIVVTADHAIRAKLDTLRTELADRAFELECQGRRDAADVINELRGRLAEFAEGLDGSVTLPRGNPDGHHL